MSILLEKRTEELVEEEFLSSGVPVCGGNLETPVTDVVEYVEEIRYSIGGRVYIENAD